MSYSQERVRGQKCRPHKKEKWGSYAILIKKKATGCDDTEEQTCCLQFDYKDKKNNSLVIKCGYMNFSLFYTQEPHRARV